MFVEKKAGKLTNLTEHLNGGAPAGHPGIAHTRWATHGRPNDVNAHPHTDCSGQLALIHNGIIENYREIKDRLLAAGHRFTSETDTEVLAHLIEQAYDGDLVEAVRRALQDVRGAYAIGVMHTAHPDRIVGARMNVPLIVGLGQRRGVPGQRRAGHPGAHQERRHPAGGRHRRRDRRWGAHRAAGRRRASIGT